MVRGLKKKRMIRIEIYFVFSDYRAFGLPGRNSLEGVLVTEKQTESHI